MTIFDWLKDKDSSDRIYKKYLEDTKERRNGPINKIYRDLESWGEIATVIANNPPKPDISEPIISLIAELVIIENWTKSNPGWGVVVLKHIHTGLEVSFKYSVSPVIGGPAFKAVCELKWLTVQENKALVDAFDKYMKLGAQAIKDEEERRYTVERESFMVLVKTKDKEI